MVLEESGAAANFKNFVSASQPYCFNTQLVSGVPSGGCADKCDATGECGSSGGEKCADLVKTYSCAEYYAPGKAYAGWCDKTCGYGSCKKAEAPSSSSYASESTRGWAAWP